MQIGVVEDASMDEYGSANTGIDAQPGTEYDKDRVVQDTADKRVHMH